ncbi:MAG: PilN domain-containing protein [Clostridium sp.]
MKDINFITNYSLMKTSEGKNTNSNINHTGICKIIVAVVLFLLIGRAVILTVSLNNLNKDLANLEGNIAKLNEVVTVKDSMIFLEKEVKQRSEILDRSSESDMINTDILSVITSIMPEELKIKTYGGSVEAGLGITGYSTERDSIAYFAYELDKIGIFENVQLSNINTSENNDDEVEYNFAITLQLKK